MKMLLRYLPSPFSKKKKKPHKQTISAHEAFGKDTKAVLNDYFKNVVLGK